MSEQEHSEHTEEPGAITAPGDDPRVTPTLVAGVIGVVVTVVIIIGLDALHHRVEEARVERRLANASTSTLERMESEQREVLNGYRWVDSEKGVVSIPIERAMELVVEESSATTPGHGGGR